MRFLDQLYNQTTFESQAEFYLGQIQSAQASALAFIDTGLRGPGVARKDSLQGLSAPQASSQ
jgi:hypothetical protein